MTTMPREMMQRLGLKPAHKPLNDKQIAAKATHDARRILKADAQAPGWLADWYAGSVSSSVLASVASGEMQIERA